MPTNKLIHTIAIVLGLLGVLLLGVFGFKQYKVYRQQFPVEANAKVQIEEIKKRLSSEQQKSSVILNDYFSLKGSSYAAPVAMAVTLLALLLSFRTTLGAMMMIDLVVIILGMINVHSLKYSWPLILTFLLFVTLLTLKKDEKLSKLQ